MKVTYFINPYAYTYIHEYEKPSTNLSFLERSRIFVYEYLSDILKEYIDWNQLEFYNKDNKIDDSSEMINNVIVYIKDPIYTPSYPYHEILKKLDLLKEDFNCLYYWCSKTSKSSNTSYGLNGISKKNGKIETHYLNVIIDDEDYLKDIFYTTDVTEMCKKRIIFFLRNNKNIAQEEIS
jgi:hypothetical protein